MDETTAATAAETALTAHYAGPFERIAGGRIDPAEFLAFLKSDARGPFGLTDDLAERILREYESHPNHPFWHFTFRTWPFGPDTPSQLMAVSVNETTGETRVNLLREKPPPKPPTEGG